MEGARVTQARPIPIFMVVDLDAKRLGFDYYRMFLTCLASLARTAEAPLDVAIAEIGWSARQKELARMAVSGRDVRIRFFGKGDPAFDRVSGELSSRGGGSSMWFGSYVWYKLSPDAFFGSGDPVLVTDCDVAYMGDVSRVYGYAVEEIGKGAGIVAAPDPAYDQGVPFREGAYFNSGFFVADFGRIGEFGALLDRAKAYSADIPPEMASSPKAHGYGIYPEQDFLNRYCADEGVRVSVFPPEYHGCPYDTVDRKYAKFGIEVDRPCIDRLETMLTCHIMGDKKWLMYDRSNAIGRRMSKAVDAAESLLCLPADPAYPTYTGPYYRETDAERPAPTPNADVLDPPCRRTVVIANSGVRRRDEFLVPSLMSLLMRTTCPLRVEMLYGDDSLDDPFFRERAGRMAEFAGRDVSFGYRKCSFDLGVFGASRYGGANLYKLFSSRLFPDADGYFLYMDSDVLVVDDVRPLFTLCDLQPDADRIVACQSHFVVSTSSYSTPAQFMGGFFLMHPLGFPSRSAQARLFAEQWHENDEYVVAQCLRRSDLVSVGNAVVEPILENNAAGERRRSALREVGCREGHVYAVHFSSAKGLDRFGRNAIPASFGKYVDEWNAMGRLAALL